MAALGLFLALVCGFWFVCDDAYIAFGYARNLAGGNGLVWHPDTEPVEGFSNPLWVLVMAAACLMSMDPVVIAPWLSAACGVTLLIWVARLLLRSSGPIAATGAMLFLATLPPMAVWSTSGLETMPGALAAFAIFATLLCDRTSVSAWTAGLAAAALALLRPEGLPLVGLWVLLGCITWQRRGRPPELGRALLIVTLVATTMAAAWLLFRLNYFGEWLPNTARAKAGLHAFRVSRGANYLVTFLLMFPGVVLGLLMAPLAWRDRATRRICVAAAAMTVAIGGYTLLVGGDFMPMGRFMVPLLPFLAMLFGLAMQQLYDRDRLVPMLAISAAAVAMNLPPAFDAYLTPDGVREHFHFRGQMPKELHGLAIWRQHYHGALSDELLAQELAKHVEPGETLIREAVGVLGYRSQLRIIDSFGLVTRRPEGDHLMVVDSSPGHDRYLPWPVLLDEQPTYIHAHFANPEEPLTYSMMNRPFEASPLADLVEVLRFAVDEPGLDGRPQELRLLRFCRWDPPTDQMQALLEACATVSPTPDSAVGQLEAALPAGPARQAQDASLRKLLDDGRIAHHGCGSVRFSHAADATSRTHGLAVLVTLQTGRAPPMALPEGKLIYAVPITDHPTIAGRESGWIVVPPNDHHVDAVHGGTMLLVHLIPGGAMSLGG